MNGSAPSQKHQLAVLLTDWMIHSLKHGDRGDWLVDLQNLAKMAPRRNLPSTPREIDDFDLPMDQNEWQDLAMEINGAMSDALEMVSLASVIPEPDGDDLEQASELFCNINRRLLTVSEGDHYGPER